MISDLSSWIEASHRLYREEEYPNHSREFHGVDWTISQSERKVVAIQRVPQYASVKVTHNWFLTGPNGLVAYHTVDSGIAWLEQFIDVILLVSERYSTMLRQGLLNEFGSVERTEIVTVFNFSGWLGDFKVVEHCTGYDDGTTSHSIFITSVADSAKNEIHPMWMDKFYQRLIDWQVGQSDSVKVGWDAKKHTPSDVPTCETLCISVLPRYYTDVIAQLRGNLETTHPGWNTAVRALTSSRESLLFFGYGLIALPDESWKI
jgi:hypothetical protein